MNVGTMIEWLKEFPEDYELSLSEYAFMPDEEDNEEMYIVCLDKPIAGLVQNDEAKDIRFLLTGKDVAEENGEHVKEIIKV